MPKRDHKKAAKKAFCVTVKAPKPNPKDSNDPPVVLLVSPPPIENQDFNDPLAL
jgi:hypothetical protein